MGLAGRLAKAGAKKAGNAAKNKIVKTVNGGCPGAANGKHSYKVKMIGGSPAKKGNVKKGIAPTPAVRGTPVTYCHNAGCGRVG